MSNSRNYKVSGKKLTSREGGWTYLRRLVKQGVIPGGKDSPPRPSGRMFRLNARQEKKAFKKLREGGNMGINERHVTANYMEDWSPYGL